MKKFFLSFSDKRLKSSLRRIKKQAKNLNFFDEYYIFDEEDLPNNFICKYKSNLIPGSRGFGYWCWKPEVIKIVLEQIKEGDTLIYVDAGCHINKNGLPRLNDYFNILKRESKGIIAFQSKSPTIEISPLNYDGRKLFDQPNYQWIKGDLFDYFGVRFNKYYTESQAIGAGIILVKKCPIAIKIINEWREIIKHNFNLLDDTPSKSPNLEGFIEHRHDQAIFTLICLKHRILTLSAYEYWYPKKTTSDNFKPDWRALKDFPIHAKRDKNFGWFYKLKTYPNCFKYKIICNNYS